MRSPHSAQILVSRHMAQRSRVRGRGTNAAPQPGQMRQGLLHSALASRFHRAALVRAAKASAA
jgi:hypothetical protein